MRGCQAYRWLWPSVTIQLHTPQRLWQRCRHYTTYEPKQHLSSAEQRPRSRPRASSYRRWTEEQDATVIRLRDSGHNIEQIAAQLPGRTYRAVQGRIQNQLRSRLHNPLRGTPLQSEELQKLAELKKQALTWDQIHAHFPERSYDAIQNAYRDRVISTTGATRRGSEAPWTDAEKKQLLHLRNELSLSFVQIAERMKQRSYRAYQRQYYHICPQRGWRVARAPEMTPAELATISQLNNQGMSWRSIAAHMGRPPITIYHSLNNFLVGIKKPRGQRFTKEEDERIIEAKAKGLRWPSVAAAVPGRTVGALAKRHHALTHEKSSSRKAKW